MFHLQSYEKADSVKQAINLLKANPEARPISGGTDVLIRLREGKKKFQHLVDIHDLAELKVCMLDEQGTLAIGAGTTFSEAISSEIINQHIPILSIAASTVGGPQIRNVATIGGNICNGVTSADSGSALMALDAVLRIEGAEGTREIPIEEFYQGPGKVDLKQHEILTAFLIPKAKYEGTAGMYSKYAMRNAMDIATIGCSAVCKVSSGVLEEIRLAFGVAAPVPIRCKETENAVRGQNINPELIQEVENRVVQEVSPRTSWRASKEFRYHIIKELAGRVVTQAIEKAGGSIK